MLLPSVHWKWTIDSISRNLQIELDAGLIFKTAFNETQLQCVPQNLLFDIHHCQRFMESVEALEISGVPFDDQTRLQIGLNATAALSFHSSIVSKSWLYKKNHSCISGPEKQLAWLNNKSENLLFLCLESQGEVRLAMNLSEEFTTGDGKTHKQFSLVSVLSDRLLSFDLLDEE